MRKSSELSFLMQTFMTADRGNGGESPAKAHFTIGDLSREFGVSLRTLRFYEARGLLTPVRDGLSRIYNGRDRARLSLIIKGKSLGFTLQEIRKLLNAQDSAGGQGQNLDLSLGQIDEQLASLKRQKLEIDAAITELERTRRSLLGSKE